ncbi:MAG: DUF5320 family protein [Conexivisphaera sp.]
MWGPMNGNGRGRGWRGGCGYGYGAGPEYGWGWGPAYPNPYAYPYPSQQSELAYLESYARQLEDELSRVKSRIDDLRKQGER